MKPFEYVRADTVEATVDLLRRHNGGNHNNREEEIQVLAGGTDLLTLMKADIMAPSSLVDVKRVTDLPDDIAQTAEGITLGALTTLSDIETSSLIQRTYPLLSQAASLAATRQLRNRATLAGNLLQRPRCWYFRNALFHCWLAGGESCPAQDGRNQFHALFANEPCCAVHPSDLAPALLALDASVRLSGPDGERSLPLAEFFALPESGRRRETLLRDDELLLSVHIPHRAGLTHSAYLKAMDRKVWAFALVSVAVALDIEEEQITRARLVLGGVAPIPWRIPAGEDLLVGCEPVAQHFSQAAVAAVADARPLRENSYKQALLQSLIRSLPDNLVAHT